MNCNELNELNELNEQYEPILNLNIHVILYHII